MYKSERERVLLIGEVNGIVTPLNSPDVAISRENLETQVLKFGYLLV